MYLHDVINVKEGYIEVKAPPREPPKDMRTDPLPEDWARKELEKLNKQYEEKVIK